MELHHYSSLSLTLATLGLAIHLFGCGSDGPEPVIDDGEDDDPTVSEEPGWPESAQSLIPDQSPTVIMVHLQALDSLLGPEGRFPPFPYWDALGWRLRPGDSANFVEFLDGIGIDLSRPAILASYGLEQSGLAIASGWAKWIITGQEPPEGADSTIEGTAWDRFQSNPECLSGVATGSRLLLPTSDERGVLWLLDDPAIGLQSMDLPDGSEVGRLYQVDSTTYVAIRFAQEYLVIDWLSVTEESVDPLAFLAPLEVPHAETLAPAPLGGELAFVSVNGEQQHELMLTNYLLASVYDEFRDRQLDQATFNVICDGIREYTEDLLPSDLRTFDWVIQMGEEQTVLRLISDGELPPLELTGSMRAVQTPGWTGYQWPAEVVSSSGFDWSSLGVPPLVEDALGEGYFSKHLQVGPLLAMREMAGTAVILPETIRNVATVSDVESVVYATATEGAAYEVGLFLRSGADRNTTQSVMGCLRNETVPPDCGTLRYRTGVPVELNRSDPDAELAGWRYRIDTIGGRTVIWLRDGEDPAEHAFARLAIRPDPNVIAVMTVDLTSMLESEDEQERWNAEALSGLSGRDRFSATLSSSEDELIWTIAYERGQRTRSDWGQPSSIYSVDTGRPTPGSVPGPCEEYVSFEESGEIDHVIVYVYDQLGRVIEERVETPLERTIESRRILQYASVDRPGEPASAIHYYEEDTEEVDKIEYYRLDWSGSWEYSVVEERYEPFIVRYEHHDDPETGLRVTIHYLVDRYGWESRLHATASLIETTLPRSDEPYRIVEQEYDTYGYGYNNASVRFRFDSSGNLIEETRFRFYYRESPTLDEVHRYTYSCWEFRPDGTFVEDNLAPPEEHGFYDLSEHLPEPTPPPIEEPEPPIEEPEPPESQPTEEPGGLLVPINY